MAGTIMSAPGEAKFIKVYHSEELIESKKRRLEAFIKEFKQRNQTVPQYIVCSPGRVNLIGDHVDYHGFSVLPMAIENAIWLGCCFSPPQPQGDVTSTTIRLENTDDVSYTTWRGPHSFAHGSELNISHKWQNYILCGYHGVLANKKLGIQLSDIFDHARQISSSQELLGKANECLKDLKNFHVLLESDLEPASGLSSSSALVCASAVATLLLLHHSQQDQELPIPISGLINSSDMAASCPIFEHLIGTHGGGMDQAVIMTAQEGYAKYVQFMPELSCENVHLPPGAIWLVSHCGVDYPKAATSEFNTRVLETKIGAAFIAKAMKATEIKLDNTLTLAKIKESLFKGLTTKEIIEYLRNNIFNDVSTFGVTQICDRLELTRSELSERFNVTDNFLRTIPNDRLELLNRCEHVFEEAERVELFKSFCLTTTDLSKIGQLMTESHQSLRDKYDCSHPALDKLVDVALEAGALGSRLTGAGWGGCIVTLVDLSRCDQVYKRLEEVSRFTFKTEPKNGCHVINIK